MIGLNNFSSLFELFAGINLAFIAVNYLNDYTIILADKVFQINTFIKENFESILTKISDLNTRLSGGTYGDQNFDNKAAEIQRAGELHMQSLTQKSNDVMDDAMKKCHFKTFGSTCLWSFLFCCFILFISGYQSVNHVYINDLNILEAVVIFSAFSIIYFFICWKWSDKNSRFIHKLSYVLSLCVGLFILSIIIAAFINIECISNYSTYLILLPISIPCFNFIVSIIPTFYKINSIKSETLGYIKRFEEKELIEFEKDAETIFRAGGWNLHLQIEEQNQITFEIKGIRHRRHEALTRIESLTMKDELTLILEPNNPYDANAIMVCTNDNIKIGYVPKELTDQFKDQNGNLKNNKSSIYSIDSSSDMGYRVRVITEFL